MVRYKMGGKFMFWIAFFFVLLVFHDLILPDFTKPAKEWMPQIMVCAVIAVMVILKLAQMASLPGETWREFKKLVGLRGS